MISDSIRLLDLRGVSGLDSQTIYHAVARQTTESSAGTILLLHPRDPYVSISFHQDLRQEVDHHYCRERGLPIIRRETGGGTVYLDRDQLFFQCVFPARKTPASVARLFELFLQAPINTYRRLGVDARFKPVNDIQVGDRKISGLGAGRIEDASVVVGNLLFSFNYKEMARVLAVPFPECRQAVLAAMECYLTTLERELGFYPDWERVKEILVEEYEKTLGVSLKPGQLTEQEEREKERLNELFLSQAWLFDQGGKKRNGIKISADVWVFPVVYQTELGELRLTVQIKEGLIEKLDLYHDFPLSSESVEELQETLVGSAYEEELLSRHLLGCCRKTDLDSLSLSTGGARWT